MQTYDLALYGEEPPTPRQAEVVRDILRAYEGARGFKVQVVLYQSRPALPILVLGSRGPEGESTRPAYYTYSPRQIETRANAQTVMFSALDNYFGLTWGLPLGHTIKYAYTANEFTSMIAEDIDLGSPLAVDVETGGVLGETVTSRTAPMLTMAFAQGSKAVVYLPYLEVELTRQSVLDILTSIEKPIFHNGKFDIAVIENNTGVRMPNWFDTMLAHHAMNHAAREHGLKALCSRYFNAEDWEADIKKWVKGKQKDYSVIPRQVLARYNGYDVLWTYRLWEKLSVEIEADDEAQKALYLEMQTADFLYDVEAAGIPFSRKSAAELYAHYNQEAYEALEVLQRLTGNQDFLPSSPKQVREALADFGVNVSSTSEEVIDSVAESTKDPQVRTFCKELINFRKAKKMLSTYVLPWGEASCLEDDSRVHPTFKVHGTTTGRLSSSEPNAQNVPRDKMIRKMVTVDEYNQLV